MKKPKKVKEPKILDFYFKNKYSDETEGKIQKWLIENPDTDENQQASKCFWDSIVPESNESTFNALGKVKSKIGSSSKGRAVPISRFFKVAAVFVLLLGLSGIWLYFRTSTEIVILRSELGEITQFTLPDSSVVWLNAGSILEYPSKFGQNNRHVNLEGEAFFSVTKNKSKPFVVETPVLSVKVLGTKFNLKAYPGERKTVATLQEGKIEVKTIDNQIQQMEPNDQLVCDNQSCNLKILKIHAEEIPDWKNHKFLFNNASLEEMLQALKRSFDLTLQIDESLDIASDRYTIKFEKGEGLEQILGLLEEVVGGFSYNIQNNRVIIKRK